LQLRQIFEIPASGTFF